METKPIKRDRNIMQLSKEHHFGLLFCWKLRQGLKKNIPPARIIPYVQHFWEIHTIPHFREEEEVVFPYINDDMVTRAIEEHAELHRLFQHLVNHPQDNAVEQLSRIADEMDKHIRYEERELFPHLERTLSAEILEQIGKQIEIPEGAIKDDYEDEFWVNSSSL